MSNEQSQVDDIRHDQIIYVVEKVIRETAQECGINVEDLDLSQMTNSFVGDYILFSNGESEGETRRDLIRMQGDWDQDRAESIKLSNIFLDVNGLIVAALSGATGIGGSLHNPLMLPLVGLGVMLQLARSTKARITQREAAVLYSMGNVKDENNQVKQEELLPYLNAVLVENKLKEMDSEELDQTLTTLSRMRCIRAIRNSPGLWILLEKIKIAD